MNLSSPSASATPRYPNEPPVSPGAAPAPASPPSIEAQVVRLGLMTPDEVATTMKEEAETGRSFTELAVEHGRVSAEDLAHATADENPAPAPVPTPPAPQTAELFLRLTSGERIAAGSFDSEDAAEKRARELMHALDGGGDWPSFDGRYIRPDAVVSIDVDLTTA